MMGFQSVLHTMTIAAILNHMAPVLDLCVCVCVCVSHEVGRGHRKVIYSSCTVETALS